MIVEAQLAPRAVIPSTEPLKRSIRSRVERLFGRLLHMDRAVAEPLVEDILADVAERLRLERMRLTLRLHRSLGPVSDPGGEWTVRQLRESFKSVIGWADVVRQRIGAGRRALEDLTSLMMCVESCHGLLEHALE